MRAGSPLGSRRMLLGQMLLLAFGSGLANAQGPVPGGSMRGEGLTFVPRFGTESWLSGTSPSYYLPYGSMGGFVPYTPEPGQGLGVMTRPGLAGSSIPQPSMGMLGQRSSLGLIRGTLTPLAPIGIIGRGGMGQGGMSGGLIRRLPSGGSMGGMGRPPVGSYPFRIPPSLLGPATSAPAMSM